MTLTTEDLDNIKRLINEFATGEELNNFATKADLTDLRGEVKVGLENVVDAINDLSPQPDRHFLTIRKRLERLEKLVL